MSPENVIQLWNETRNKKSFREKLMENGFKFLKSGRSSTVYTRPDVKYVVKISRGLNTRRFREPELEQFRLPYIFLNGNRQIGIQPKVNRNRKSKYRAFRKICDAVPPELFLDIYDIHQDNVGWLNRKPVIFDYK